MKFLYKNTAIISDLLISQTLSQLKNYHTNLCNIVSSGGYSLKESSLNLPSDETILNNVENLAKKKLTNSLKYIVVVGIGGSNLGAKAIYDAIFGHYDLVDYNRFPKIIFLDTQDSDVLVKINLLFDGLTNKDQLIINAISKSGETIETATNLEVLFSILSTKFGKIFDRFVLTTDKWSKMHNKATRLGIDTLAIPHIVGGRYSILSAVGLFPLALSGIDINKVRMGAVKMRKICVNSSVFKSPAAISASVLYQHSLHGKHINNNFIFLPQLESLGKWYRQLMGESVGKDGKGITPIISIGSADLHSVGQLYFGGPKDKFTTFIYNENDESEINVPSVTVLGLVPAIKGKSTRKIMRAIIDGTKNAYRKQGLPYVEVVFDGVGEEELGAFMQFKMIEMMYLGNLMGVNAFDQPHVELYKTETKKILKDVR